MVTLERINRKLDDANRRLALLARQDPLTDALNRHAFQSMLSSELQPRGGVVAVVDIDYLKAINDGAGHAAGDRALRQVARALRSLIRADDLLFRWGGDEFLVVLDTVDLEHAHRRFDELHDLLAEAEVPDSIPGGRLSASFGLAEFSSVDELDDAISTADERMYRQRRSRRGRETHV
jgi:diguanylate cyclase (GGDEF)-like protein